MKKIQIVNESDDEEEVIFVNTPPIQPSQIQMQDHFCMHTKMEVDEEKQTAGSLENQKISQTDQNSLISSFGPFGNSLLFIKNHLFPKGSKKYEQNSMKIVQALFSGTNLEKKDLKFEITTDGNVVFPAADLKMVSTVEESPILENFLTKCVTTSKKLQEDLRNGKSTLVFSIIFSKFHSNFWNLS